MASPDRETLYLYVHGIGDPEPGESARELIEGATERTPIAVKEETHWIREVSENQADERNIRAFKLPLFKVVDRPVTVAEVNWSDLSSLRNDLFGIIGGAFGLLFGLRYIAHQSVDGIGTFSARFLQWAGLLASRLIIGPLVAIHLLLLSLYIGAVACDFLYSLHAPYSGSRLLLFPDIATPDELPINAKTLPPPQQGEESKGYVIVGRGNSPKRALYFRIIKSDGLQVEVSEASLFEDVAKPLRERRQYELGRLVRKLDGMWEIENIPPEDEEEVIQHVTTILRDDGPYHVEHPLGGDRVTLLMVTVCAFLTLSICWVMRTNQIFRLIGVSFGIISTIVFLLALAMSFTPAREWLVSIAAIEPGLIFYGELLVFALIILRLVIASTILLMFVCWLLVVFQLLWRRLWRDEPDKHQWKYALDSLAVACVLPAAMAFSWSLVIPLIWMAINAIVPTNSDFDVAYQSLFDRATSAIESLLLVLLVLSVGVILGIWGRRRARFPSRHDQGGGMRLIVNPYLQWILVIIYVAVVAILVWNVQKLISDEVEDVHPFLKALSNVNAYLSAFVLAGLPLAGRFLFSYIRSALDLVFDVVNHFYFESKKSERTQGIEFDYVVDGNLPEQGESLVAFQEKMLEDHRPLVKTRVFDAYGRRIESDLAITPEVGRGVNDDEVLINVRTFANETLRSFPVRRAIQKRVEASIRHLSRLVKEAGITCDLILISHSQGTMAAIGALNASSLRESLGAFDSVRFVTMGSPFTHIYQHYFPHLYPELNHDRWRNLREALERGKQPFLPRWTNIYRIDDYVGRWISDPSGTLVENVPVGVGRDGIGGHLYYLRDQRVIDRLRSRSITTPLHG